MKEATPSKEYIDYICSLYGDVYDDRVEDCRPPAAGTAYRNPGSQWAPGQTADHKSLTAFHRQLEEMGIHLSSSKIRKILVTGGCWSTCRSREIGQLFKAYTKPVSEGGRGLAGDAAAKQIAAELGVSIVTVSVNLPYQNVVYKLEVRSRNAIRCARYKERKKKKGEQQ